MVLGGKTAIISLVSSGTSEDLLKHFLEVGIIEFPFTTLHAKCKKLEKIIMLIFLIKCLIIKKINFGSVKKYTDS